MKPLLPLGILLATALILPTAKASECSLDQEVLCDIAHTALLDEVFGQYADIALLVLGGVAATLVLILLASLAFRLKPTRLLALEAGDRMKEAEPGGTARFKLELENQNARLPVDVFLEHEPLPDGWNHELSASVVLPSGFKRPQALTGNASFTLSSEARGANQAVVEVRLTPPADTQQEDTVDYELRAVPYFKGKVRKRRSRKARLSVLVTPHLPKVQILRVVHDPERIVIGSPVRTRAILANKGERDASDVAVRFLIDGRETDKKIVPSLGVNGETEVEFNWTPHAGENKIRVALGA